MNIWQAIVLGAVQGFTEFLPVSSSGHLILARRWFGIRTAGGLFFDVTLHLGTIIPIIVIYFGKIKGIVKKPFPTVLFLIIASVPAAVTGFLFQDGIETAFMGEGVFSVALLSITFLLTAAELFVITVLSKNSRRTLPLTAKSSLIMGIFQGFAVIPGLSRSGTTLTGGAVMRLDRTENADFAFLMSIPVILGAAAVSGVKAVKTGAEIAPVPILFGVTTAAVTGYMAINVTLKAVKRGRLNGFSYYLIAIAAASVLTKVIFGV